MKKILILTLLFLTPALHAAAAARTLTEQDSKNRSAIANALNGTLDDDAAKKRAALIRQQKATALQTAIEAWPKQEKCDDLTKKALHVLTKADYAVRTKVLTFVYGDLKKSQFIANNKLKLIPALMSWNALCKTPDSSVHASLGLSARHALLRLRVRADYCMFEYAAPCGEYRDAKPPCKDDAFLINDTKKGNFVLLSPNNNKKLRDASLANLKFVSSLADQYISQMNMAIAPQEGYNDDPAILAARLIKPLNLTGHTTPMEARLEQARYLTLTDAQQQEFDALPEDMRKHLAANYFPPAPAPAAAAAGAAAAADDGILEPE